MLKKSFRRYQTWALATALLLSFTNVFAQSGKTGAPKGQFLDSIAIIVNDSIITQREWLSAYNSAKSDVARIPSNLRPSEEVLKQEVANHLIFQNLENALATKNGVTISDAALDAAIDDIVKRNNATLAQLKAFLNYSGQSFSLFRENIRKQMLSARIRDEIIRTTKVTNNEVDLFIKSADFKKALTELQKKNVKQWNTKHILIPINASLSEEEALSRISRIRTRILGGESFDDLAKAQSQDPISAAKGGDLGWVSLGQLTPKFEQAMQALPLNQISEPVQTAFGYHLILVSEVREGEMDENSIRITAKEMLFRKKAAIQWQQWRQELLSSAYIEKRI